MNIFDRVKAAVAAFRAKGVTVSRDVALNDLLDFLGVDHSLRGDAQSEATYYACQKVLSESVGKLPLKVQQYTPDRGINVARGHQWYRALNERPNRFMSASTFWSTMELCRLHYGNAYAWIDTRDPARPQLWPIDPSTVRVWYDNAAAWNVPDVYYQVTTPKGMVVLGSEEVLHFKSHQTKDGLVGISVAEQLASTIQSSVKAQKVMESLYDSGMTSKAVLQYTGSLNDANVQTLVAEIGNYLKTNNGTDKLVPLPLGFNLTPLNMKLADSQFIEIKQYTALQIASAFGVKPYQIGDYTKSSYASAEAQQLSFLVDTLLFIVKQYEEEIGYKLLSSEDEAAGFHVKFNTAVILRADQQTQINTLSAAVSNFLMTPNEAREKIDLPAKPGGDQLLGNGASIPVQYTGAQYTNINGKEDEKKWMIEAISTAVKAVLEA